MCKCRCMVFLLGAVTYSSRMDVFDVIFYSLWYDIPSLPERCIFKCHHLFPNVLLYLGERGRLLCLRQSRTEQTSQPQSLCGDNSREATTTTVSFPVLHRFSRHSLTDKKKRKKEFLFLFLFLDRSCWLYFFFFFFFF